MWEGLAIPDIFTNNSVISENTPLLTFYVHRKKAIFRKNEITMAISSLT